MAPVLRFGGILVLGLLGFNPPGHTGELGKLPLADRPIQLLGGRLTVRMPAAARVEPRQRSIMSAAESGEEETRVVLDAGPERLVLLASELFARFEGDLETG